MEQYCFPSKSYFVKGHVEWSDSTALLGVSHLLKIAWSVVSTMGRRYDGILESHGQNISFKVEKKDQKKQEKRHSVVKNIP